MAYIAILILNQQLDAIIYLGVHIGEYLVNGGIVRPGPLVLMVLGVLGYAFGAQWHQAVLYLLAGVLSRQKLVISWSRW